MHGHDAFVHIFPEIIEPNVRPFRSEDDRYRKIVETAHEGIWTIDHVGCTTYVNRRMTEMLGYSAAEMLGKIHTTFMFVEDQPKGDVDMESRRVGTTEQWDQRYRKKSGEELWTLASCCPLYSEDGKFTGALGMFTDITARKRSELELRQREEQLALTLKSRDDFLAMLSHELRVPLNPILLLASSRVRHAKEDDPDLPLFRTVVDNAKHQARLIDDILDLTKLGKGKLILRSEVIDMRDVIKRSIASLMPAFEEKNVQLQWLSPDDEMLVSGDSDRLQQVIGNVVGNAIKFTPPNGWIKIALMREGDWIRMICEDTGIGLSEAEVSRVFEAFFQGEHTQTSKSHGGLGLGLALSRMILELHRGRLSAWSAGAGLGSTFTLEVPAYEGHAPIKAPAQRRDSFNTMLFSNRHVLVVDDHPPTREAMRHLLGCHGVHVHLAGSCTEALAAAAAVQLDLLLCDLGLPDGDGCDLMAQIAEKYPVKGIAVTGFGHATDVQRSRLAGFSVHLTKPIAAGDLDLAVTTLLSEV